MKKKCLIIVLFTLLSACSAENDKQEDSKIEPTASAEKSTPVKGGLYRIASIGEASNLIPWTSTDGPSHAISSYIYNGMLKYDENLELEGDMAKSWVVSDDGLQITFYLRDDILWSDGSPFTAYDVLATYNTLTASETLTPYSGSYEDVIEAKVLDDYTFQVKYGQPFSPSLASWTLAILPKSRLEKEDINNSSLKEHPMGTGKYTLDKWKRGEYITLKANKTHYIHEPYLSDIRTRLIPDVDTQFLELKAGNIDTMTLKPLQFARLTDSKSFKEKFNKYSYLANGYTYLGFKLDHPIFRDKKVRQALSYAISRKEIVDGVMFGQGIPLACPFKPGTWAYNEKIKPYPQDMAKAKKMLTEAGWADTDDDGIIDKVIDGIKRQFEFTVVTNQGNDVRKMTAELIQQSFSKLGIKMKINIQEWSSFIQNTINKRQFEAYILGWGLSPEPDPYDIFHSSKTGEKEFNIVGFNNKEADELMVKARRTFVQSERKKYLDRFQEILHEEQPYLFLYAPFSLVAIHKRIHNIKANELGLGDDFEEWYVPEQLQTRTVIQN